MENWKKQIHRNIIGPQHDLETLEGYWIKPRKYSYAGAEEIHARELEFRRSIKNPKALKFIKRLQDKGIEEFNINNLLEELTEEELIEFMDALGDIGQKKNTELQRFIVRYGIGEHNFTDDEGKPCEINDGFLDVIFESQDVVNEIAFIIMEYNRPLPLTTSGKSAKSLNGQKKTRE